MAVSDIIQDQISEVRTFMNFAAGQVKRETNRIINKLPVDPDTGEIYFVGYEASDQIQATVQIMIDSDNYRTIVDNSLEKVNEIREFIEGDYRERFGPTPQAAADQNITAQQETEAKIAANLSPELVIEIIANPLIDVLSNAATNQDTTRDQLKAQTGAVIDNGFTKYGRNKVATPMEMFARSVEANLNLHYQNIGQFFKYGDRVGKTALGNDMRGFCSQYVKGATPEPGYERLGNVSGIYHEEEIKQWPAENNHDWGGMIEGTNEGNIFINAGGYGCQHFFEPVPLKDVPESALRRARERGYIT